MNIKKPFRNWQKLSNSSYVSFFNCVVPDFLWLFHKRNINANLKAKGLLKRKALKRNYLEQNQALNEIWRTVSLSIAKYKTSNIVGNGKKH